MEILVGDGPNFSVWMPVIHQPRSMKALQPLGTKMKKALASDGIFFNSKVGLGWRKLQL
jgi:hypothetical protein